MKSVSLFLILAVSFISLFAQAQKQVFVRYAKHTDDLGHVEASEFATTGKVVSLEPAPKIESHKLYLTQAPDSITDMNATGFKPAYPLVTKVKKYYWKTPTGSVTRIIGDMPYADLIKETIVDKNGTTDLTLQPTEIKNQKIADKNSSSKPVSSKTKNVGSHN